MIRRIFSKKVLLLVLTFLIKSVSAWGGVATIQGRVVDDSGKPISGASVAFEIRGEKELSIIQTDKDGKFERTLFSFESFPLPVRVFVVSRGFEVLRTAVKIPRSDTFKFKNPLRLKKKTVKALRIKEALPGWESAKCGSFPCYVLKDAEEGKVHQNILVASFTPALGDFDFLFTAVSKSASREAALADGILGEKNDFFALIFTDFQDQILAAYSTLFGPEGKSIGFYTRAENGEILREGDKGLTLIGWGAPEFSSVVFRLVRIDDDFLIILDKFNKIMALVTKPAFFPIKKITLRAAGGAIIYDSTALGIPEWNVAIDGSEIFEDDHQGGKPTVGKDRAKEAEDENEPEEGETRDYLKFLTANVGNLDVTAGNQCKLKDEDVPVLAANIRLLAPDIIFLQEIQANTKDQMSRILGEVDEFGNVSAQKDYFWDCWADACTAVKRNIFSDFQLEFAIGASCPLYNFKSQECYGISALDFAIFGASARLANFGLEVYLINVHTSSPVNDRSFAIRSYQIKSLLDGLEQMADEKISLIAAGDFNFDPYRYGEFLRNSGIDETVYLTETKKRWQEVIPEDGSGEFRLISSDEVTQSFPKKVGYTLDHVIVNFGEGSCEVLDGKGGRARLDKTLSGKGFMDHRGVFCRISLSPSLKY